VLDEFEDAEASLSARASGVFAPTPATNCSVGDCERSATRLGRVVPLVPLGGEGGESASVDVGTVVAASEASVEDAVLWVWLWLYGPWEREGWCPGRWQRGSSQLQYETV
jgi:hypothetical protein